MVAPSPTSVAGPEKGLGLVTPCAVAKENVVQVTDFELVAAGIGRDVSALPADGWLPAVVPGGVHESLLAAGQIEDPYQDRNESDVRWIEERDWWFRGSFPGPAELAGDERVRLVFLGLDTVVDIWLNGRPLGHHENMFRPAEFDVTERLLDHNELLLRFSPPLHDLTVPASVAELPATVRRLVRAIPHR